jgi:hypothetical protein
VDLELLIFRLARPGQVLCGDTIKKYRDVQQSGWAAIVIDDLTSINPWQPRMLEIRGRAEAIPPVAPASVRNSAVPSSASIRRRSTASDSPSPSAAATHSTLPSDHAIGRL